MIVPTLKTTQVAAQPLAGGYADASVSALSQGGGVAQGISSIGGVLADEAVKAKRQADQVEEFNATADVNDFADVLYQDLDAKEGPAAMQAYEALMPAYDQAVSERLSRITSPVAREAADQNSRITRGNLFAKAKANAEPKRFKMSVDANQRVLGSYNKSITLAVTNGGVNVSGEGASEVLDESAIAPYFAQAHETNVKFAELNADKLGTDKETYVRLADAAWKEDAYKSVMDGLLARGDDRAAAAFFEEHKAEFNANDIETFGKDVARASHIGDVGRATYEVLDTAMGATGDVTLAERESMAMADVGQLPKELQADARKQVGEFFEMQRKQDARVAADSLAVVDKAFMEGATLADVQKTAAWGQMTPGGQRAILELDEQRRKGVAAAEEAKQNEVYAQAIRAASEPASRAEFATLDLLEIRPFLSKAQYDDLAKIQADIKAGKDVSALQTDDAIIEQAAQYVATFADEDERSIAHDRVKVDMWDTVRRERSLATAAGKPFGEEQVIEIRNRFMGMATYDQSGPRGNKTMPAALIDPETIDPDEIHEDERGWIIEQLKAAGRPAEDIDVARAWVNLLKYDRL